MEDRSFFVPEAPGENEGIAYKKRTFPRRIVQAWLRVSGPNARRFSSSLEDQERLRRSHILSALFLLVVVAALITLPTAIPVPTYWIPILTLVGSGFISLLFNRAAYINLSALFLIFAIDATLAILMITLPTGIRNSNIPDFDLFLISTLIGGFVLPRRLLPFLALLHIIIIFSLFVLLPHDLLLTQEIQINQKGFAYSELSDAFLLQFVAASIAWLNAWSVDRALLRASKAEELAAVQRSLTEQARQQVEQKERLEYGIAVLKDAHARFANGDYRARANLQDNELASLAFSFNLLAERLYRVAQTAQEQERLGLAFQQLFSIQEDVVYRGTLRPLAPTGTLVDKIYPWLKQYYQFRQMYIHCGVPVEKVRLSLTRQRTLLAQLNAALDQVRTETRLAIKDTSTLTSSLELIGKAQSLCEQVEEQGKIGLQETKLLEQLLRV